MIDIFEVDKRIMSKLIHLPRALSVLLEHQRQHLRDCVEVKNDLYLIEEIAKIGFQKDDVSDTEKDRVSYRIRQLYQNDTLGFFDHAITRNSPKGVYISKNANVTIACLNRYYPDLFTLKSDDADSKLEEDSKLETTSICITPPKQQTKVFLQVFNRKQFDSLLDVRIHIRGKLNSHIEHTTKITDVVSVSESVDRVQFLNNESYTPMELRNNFEFQLPDSPEWQPFGVYE